MSPDRTDLKCSGCGSVIESGSKFCGRCGRPFDEDIICGLCGKTLPGSFLFCTTCGNDLKKQNTGLSESEFAELREKAALRKTARNQKEERRMVTILFADITGFTTLSEMLDPEDVKDTINSIFDILSRIIISEGGTIDKYIGDCIMSLFGAPISYGDDAARAVRAAIKMQNAVAEFAAKNIQKTKKPLKMRVGINTGLVLAGYVGSDLRQDYTVMGAAVNLANRMETSCEPGKILVSGYTRNFVADSFEMEYAGEYNVKGIDYPIPAHYVLKERDMTVKHLNFLGRPISLTGRKEELRRLFSIYGSVCGNVRPQAVLIEGAIGTGKSALLAEFFTTVTETTVLYGRASVSDNTEPLTPILQALRNYFNYCGGENDESVLIKQYFGDEDTPLLNLIQGKNIQAGEHVDSNRASLKSYINRLICNLLKKLSLEKPLLLLISDAQKLDSATLEFLDFMLGDNDITARIMIIIELKSPHSIRPFGGLDRVETIRLEKLDPQSQAALTAEILAGAKSIPDWLTKWIMDNCNGNPLFIIEFIRSLSGLGIIKEINKSGIEIMADKPDSILLPPTIHSAVQSTLDRLSNEEKNMLQNAAIIGFAFWNNILTSITGSAKTTAVLSLLAGKGIIKKRFHSSILNTEEYRFINEIIWDVIYKTIPLKKLPEIHRKCAEALEFLGLGRFFPAMIAEHHEKGKNYKAALRCYLEAANYAYDIYSLEEIRKLLSMVQQIFAKHPETLDSERTFHIRYLYFNAELLRISGNYEEAMQYIEKAESILHISDDSSFTSSEFQERTTQLERLKGLIFEQQGEFEKALEIYESMIKLVNKADIRDKWLFYYALAAKSWMLIKLKRIDEAEKISIEITNESSYDIPDPNLAGALARHFDNLVEIYIRKGKYKEAAVAAEKSLSLTKISGNPRKISVSENNIACAKAMQGLWDEAATAFEKCLKQRELYGNPFDTAISHLNLAESYYNLKNIEKADFHFDRSKDIIKKYGLGLQDELKALEELALKTVSEKT